MMISAMSEVDTAFAAAETPERSFLRALELFDTAASPEQYRDAALAFEAIAADGFRNGAVYYNAGNAWFRAGEYGRAILNYRKAKPYRPRDAYLEANLRQALMTAPGHLTEAPAPLWSHLFFWNQWLSFAAKVKLASTGFLLAAVLTVIAVALRRRYFRLPIAVILLASVAVAVDAGLNYAEVEDSSRAIITAETTARKGTGKDYEPAFDQPLRDGAEFRIVEETSDWVLGRFEGIGDGWIRKEFIAR